MYIGDLRMTNDDDTNLEQHTGNCRGSVIASCTCNTDIGNLRPNMTKVAP